MEHERREYQLRGRELVLTYRRCGGRFLPSRCAHGRNSSTTRHYLHVVRVYDRGRKPSEKELRSAEGVVGDVRTHTVTINGKHVNQAVCMGQTTENLPPLPEPQLTGISPLALGLEATRKRKRQPVLCSTVRTSGAGRGEIVRRNKTPPRGRGQ